MDRSRCDLFVTDRPALRETLRGVTCVLAGFRLFNGHVAMKLGWRTCGPGVGTESVAHGAFTRRQHQPGSQFVLTAVQMPTTGPRTTARRPVARRVVRQRPPLRRVRPVKPVPHARRRSDHSSAFATRPFGRLCSRVIRQENASFFRVAFRYPCDRSVTWPGDAGLPSFVARRHSWGFKSLSPFTGLLPLTGGFASRRRAVSRTTRPTDPGFFAGPFSSSASGVSAGPGPRAVCRRSSAPICFRRGDRSLARSLGDEYAVRLLGFAPVCGPPA